MTKFDLLSSDVLCVIADYLSVDDLLNLSKTCKFFRSPAVEPMWKRRSQSEFGVKSASTRQMLVHLDPDISWRSTYMQCTQRVIHFWYDSFIWDATNHQYPPTIHPSKILVPKGIFIKDFGIDTTGSLRLYVLSNLGRVFEYPTQMTDDRTVSLKDARDLFPRSGKCVEMVVRPNRVVAVDTAGNWWYRDAGTMLKLWSEHKIWPSTLLAKSMLNIVALSVCGRYIYYFQCGSTMNEPMIIGIDGLANGAPLRAVRQFKVAYGTSQYFMCALHAGKSVYCVRVAQDLKNESMPVQFMFAFNDTLEGVLMFENNIAILALNNNKYLKLEVEFEEDGVEYSVAVSPLLTTGSSESNPLKPIGPDRERIVYKCSPRGEFRLEAEVVDAHYHRDNTQATYEVHSHKSIPVNMPPVCHYWIRPDGVSALCLRNSSVRFDQVGES